MNRELVQFTRDGMLDMVCVHMYMCEEWDSMVEVGRVGTLFTMVCQ